MPANQSPTMELFAYGDLQPGDRRAPYSPPSSMSNPVPDAIHALGVKYPEDVGAFRVGDPTAGVLMGTRMTIDMDEFPELARDEAPNYTPVQTTTLSGHAVTTFERIGAPPPNAQVIRVWEPTRKP